MNRTLAVMALAIVLCAPCASTAAPAGSEAPDDPVVRETVDVDVVDIDVVVTDAKGQPISGLTAEDFQILEDGKKVKITNFAELRGAPSASGAAPSAAPTADAGANAPIPVPDGPDPAGLNLVVYVDEWNIHPLRRNQVLERIRGFFDDRLGPGFFDVPGDGGPPVMLVASAPDVRVVRPFTRDRAALRAGIEELVGRTAPGTFGQGTRDEQLADVDRSVQTVTDCMRRPDCDQQLLENTVRATVNQIRETSRQLTLRSEASLEGLRLVCAALGRVRGEKSVLYVSDGFSLDAGTAMIRNLRDKIAHASGPGFSGADSGVVGGDTSERNDRMRRAMLDVIDRTFTDTSAINLAQALERVAAEATTNRVRVYSIQAEGLQSGVPGADRSSQAAIADMAATAQFLGPQATRAPLDLMADATGGVVLQGGLRTEEILGRVISEFENRYSIGYRMPRAPDGGYRTIKVKVSTRGARVRAPSGYRATTPEQRRGEAVLAALTAPVPDNPDGLAVSFAEARTDDQGRTVVPTTVLVPIARMQLAPEGANHATDLKLFVAARTAEGRFSLFKEYPIQVRIPSQHVEAARGQAFPVRLDVAMTSGANEVAVGVWDDNGPLRSFARGTMVVE